MTVLYTTYIPKYIQELFEPGAQPATCTMSTAVSFPRVKRSRRGVAINLHLMPSLRKVEIYIYSPSGHFYGLLYGELYLLTRDQQSPFTCHLGKAVADLQRST